MTQNKKDSNAGSISRLLELQTLEFFSYINQAQPCWFAQAISGCLEVGFQRNK
jgi:hypothetical protein